jgi:Trm5-related predicted tRNA methylase
LNYLHFAAWISARKQRELIWIVNKMMCVSIDEYYFNLIHFHKRRHNKNLIKQIEIQFNEKRWFIWCSNMIIVWHPAVFGEWWMFCFVYIDLNMIWSCLLLIKKAHVVVLILSDYHWTLSWFRAEKKKLA